MLQKLLFWKKWAKFQSKAQKYSKNRFGAGDLVTRMGERDFGAVSRRVGICALLLITY